MKRRTVEGLMLRTASGAAKRSNGWVVPPRVGFLSSDAASSASKATQKPVGLTGRQIAFRSVAFLSFSAVMGLAGLAYAISSDPEILWKTRDSFPGLVNFIAPFVGLPVVKETGELDVEQLGPRDISELVGDKVDMGIKLSNGSIIVVTSSSTESMAQLCQRALENQPPGLQVNDVFALDSVRAAELRAKSPEDIKDEFAMRIPQVPSVKNEHTLTVALELCYHMQNEIAVQKRLLQERRLPVDHFDRAESELVARMAELEDMLRTEKKNHRRGWFR